MTAAEPCCMAAAHDQRCDCVRRSTLATAATRCASWLRGASTPGAILDDDPHAYIARMAEGMRAEAEALEAAVRAFENRYRPSDWPKETK
jgi:hypothetical protein